MTKTNLDPAPTIGNPPETMDRWAARVAPTLDSSGWRQAKSDAGNHPDDDPPRQWRVAAACALRAFRDGVAGDLDARLVATLKSEGRTEEASLWTDLDRLVEYGLLDQDHRRTDFGREVDRVLRGDLSHCPTQEWIAARKKGRDNG